MRKRIVNLLLALSIFFTATFISPVSHEVSSQVIDAEDNKEEASDMRKYVEEEETEALLINETEEDTEDETTQDSIEEKEPTSQTEEKTQEPKKEETNDENLVEESVEKTEPAEDAEKEVEVEEGAVEIPNTAQRSVTRQIDGFTPPDTINGPSIRNHFSEAGDSVNQGGASDNMMILTYDTENTDNRDSEDRGIRTGRWSNRQVDLNKDFTIEMYVYMNQHVEKAGLSGDGLTFTMHKDSDGVEAIGAKHGGLGAYDGISRDAWVGRQKNGIENGLSIEFDMYNDIQKRTRTLPFWPYGYQSHYYVDWNYDGDLRKLGNSSVYGDGDRHTAFVRTDYYESSNDINPDRMQHINPKPIDNPHSDKWRKLTINWKYNGGQSGTLSYSFDQNPDKIDDQGSKITNSYNINDIDEIFDTNSNNRKVWWGLTASTGTLDWERQEDPLVARYMATMESAVAFETIPQQTVEMEMFVRNKTRNGDFKSQETIEAYPGDILEYQYALINPKINGVFDDWENIQITNQSAENILVSSPRTFGNYNVEYDFDKDARVEVNGGEFKVKDDAEAGTYSNLTATATGNIGESTDTTMATSNGVTIEVLPIPEVNFTQKVENNTYSAGNMGDQKVVDVMEGDEIVLTAQLKHDSSLPISGQYSVTLPSVLSNSISRVVIDEAEISAEYYSIDESTSILSIEKVRVGDTGATTIQIFSTVGEIAESFDETLKSEFYADNGLVLKEPGLEMSFIPNDGILFEVADLDFGTQVISSQHKRYERVVGEEPLIRIELPVRSTQEFTKVTASYDSILPGTIIEKENGQEFKEIKISEFNSETENIYTWNSNQLYLNVPAGKALIEEQSSEITWTLQNVP